jgi:hypothetical protein
MAPAPADRRGHRDETTRAEIAAEPALRAALQAAELELRAALQADEPALRAALQADEPALRAALQAAEPQRMSLSRRLALLRERAGLALRDVGRRAWGRCSVSTTSDGRRATGGGLSPHQARAARRDADLAPVARRTGRDPRHRPAGAAESAFAAGQTLMRGAGGAERPPAATTVVPGTAHKRSWREKYA